MWANIRGRRRYFLKLETFIPHKDHPGVDISERGSSGPVKSESSLKITSFGMFIKHPVAGYFGHNSYITQQFLRACEAIGIPSSPDVNTSKGTLGATKVNRVHILDQLKPHARFVDKFRQAVYLPGWFR